MKNLRCLALLSLCLAACSVKGPVSLDRVQAAIDRCADGDTVFVAPGFYDDTLLEWKGNGHRVVVTPANGGGSVVLGGSSRLRIYGKGLEVRGFHFRDGSLGEKEGVVEFRKGDSLAVQCRLTDCVIDSYNASRRDISNSYVQLYGRDNRVDHNEFIGKRNLGVTLVVMLNYEGCIDNGHRIDHNYFGPRPVYGSNGAETIRVGTSQQCMRPSRTVIEDNLFERCDGEVEVVSIKSCDNIIRRNVFYECQGVLALRHGDRNVAEGNIFIGNGIRNTGGVRIVGEDQKVLSNSFLSLRGTRFFSPLALMCGVPNSLPNRYMQVKRTIVKDNVFADCSPLEFDTGKDFERTLPPVGTVFEGNTISARPLPEPSGIREGKGASWSKGARGYAKGEETAPEVEEIVISESTVLEKGIEIRRPTRIVAAPGTSPVLSFGGRKSGNFITIFDGGSLYIEGIGFDGTLIPGKANAKGFISTGKDMTMPYKLEVRNCSFRNCGEGGFIPIKGLKGTFADSVTVKGCRFEDLSGDAIYYAAESDDKGRYNADDMLIEDCTFRHILGTPVNIYRGGSDESTAGPYVTLRGCRFIDCNNKVRGSVVRIIGAQVLDIIDNSFTDSGKGGYSIRLDDAPWEKITFRGNSFRHSGAVLSNRNL